uniref:Beta-Casp domain-containing protein n=2 Tax=Kalanchoe fedtschenkoi TaxID=63787 RepID=A0A7N0T5Q8_KALFE
MNLTCLSKGRGFYSPPCQLMDFCDFRILVNCPMDLSALSIFSPNLQRTVVESDDDHLERSEDVEGVSRKRRKTEKPVDASDLIHAVPWYKFVGNLTLWNISSIDVVLISSPMAMLGLPFLTHMDGFCAKVYATEVTVKLGEILMKDIVSMHTEFKQIYGPGESEFPDWMRWENLEKLPSKLEEIAAGELGVELNAWMPLYSAAHVKDCVKMIHSLKYAEETCYNGAINITAFSCGTEVGACNWRLNGQGTNLVYLSASVLASTHATEFNFQALRKSDLLLCSDLSSSSLDSDPAQDPNVGSSVYSRKDNENQEASAQSLISADESREEMEKLSFICSVVIESVRTGGSVLIPIGRPGLILLLLEQISACLESSDVKVPMYFISSVAEELLAFTNIIPEWLCKERQEKLFSCEPLFGHTDLIKAKKLLLFPAIHSLDLLKTWEEPCIVFAPHWSLRLGPAVHLLQRWRADPNSLLITEEGPDADLSLLPFMPMAMKVLQCSFLSNLTLSKIQPLLKAMRPKRVLLPEELRHLVPSTGAALPYAVTHYAENETVTVPIPKNNAVVEITAEVASQLQWKKTNQADIGIARLIGDLSIQQGKHRLLPSRDDPPPQPKPRFFWGSPDPQILLSKLKEAGVSSSIETRSAKAFDAHITEPGKALVQVRETSTVICSATEHLASLVYSAVVSTLDGV